MSAQTIECSELRDAINQSLIEPFIHQQPGMKTSRNRVRDLALARYHFMHFNVSFGTPVSQTVSLDLSPQYISQISTYTLSVVNFLPVNTICFHSAWMFRSFRVAKRLLSNLFILTHKPRARSTIAEGINM